MRRGVIIGFVFVIAYYLAESSWFDRWLWNLTHNDTMAHMLKGGGLFTIGFITELIAPQKR